jgi:hypothetical protein
MMANKLQKSENNGSVKFSITVPKSLVEALSWDKGDMLDWDLAINKARQPILQLSKT